MFLKSLSTQPAPVRIVGFLVILVALWLPMAGIIGWQVREANQVTILAMTALFLVFLGLLPLWGRRVHRYRQPFAQLGWVVSRQSVLELGQGVGLGAGSIFALFVLQGWLGWITWQPVPLPVARLAIEAGLVGLGVGLAEELLFRGWLLNELEQDYPPRRSLWLNSTMFAVLHFLKPIAVILQTLPQLVGLVLLGMALVWAKRAVQGRLSLPIGLHAGLVSGLYFLQVGQLVNVTHQVPAWVTGLQGNPLAGLVGLAGLAGLAVGMRSHVRACHPCTAQSPPPHGRK